jgi:ubiquinone/menaquinone biosynthesis C-methylase UbiE|tara:strand:- start:400 stop:1047 length:648 start_codon:yes stop_codon:yes gene_type:complete
MKHTTDNLYYEKYFNNMPEYRSNWSLVRWIFYKRLHVTVEYLRELNPKIIVDLGCGEGKLIKEINNEMRNLVEKYAVDLNQDVIKLNGNIKNCLFSCQNITNTDFEDNMFDAVVCLDTLEHIEDIQSAFNEIGRILKTKSYLITSSPSETVIYKLLRFILKGTFSDSSGPAAGKHYHDAYLIEEFAKIGFDLIKSRKIPLPIPFDLFHVNLYMKK